MENELEKILREAKPENRIFIELNLGIRWQVLHILSTHATIKNIEQLAKEMNVGKIALNTKLNGLNDITLEFIAKLTAVLGEDIIMTDLKAKEKYKEK